jgi:HSP20 family protein
MAETNEAIIVEVEIPGVERKDIQVEVDGEVLRITGERRVTVKRQGRQYCRTERSYGRFERQLPLPASVNRAGIRVQFRAGILIITLPKQRTASASPTASQQSQ